MLCEENLGASLDESVDEIVKYFTRASRLVNLQLTSEREAEKMPAPVTVTPSTGAAEVQDCEDEEEREVTNCEGLKMTIKLKKKTGEQQQMDE